MTQESREIENKLQDSYRTEKGEMEHKAVLAMKNSKYSCSTSFMTNDGTFKKHIQHAVSEAKRQCEWLLRTFGTRQVLPMLILWKSLVQCKLNYCSQLCCPTETGDI
ncbi:hypothetical protein LSAT2_031752 [Lamellibrachia satsuma]|nr:hypothetical protein LSAT2_031752 [Lamellibrachia satsuma]